MPRVTDSRPYDERRTSDKVRKVTLFIIFEGLAEMQYFTELSNRGFLKAGSMIKEIRRRGIDRDNANRLAMIEMAHDFIIFRTSGRCTLRRYITTVINDFYAQYRDYIDKNKSDFRVELQEFRDELCERFKVSDDIGDDGLIKDGSLLYKDIEKECAERYDIERRYDESFEMSNTDELSGFAYTKRDDDRIFVVYDRDYNADYFNHEMYDQCLDLCMNGYGYTPLITSPQFEFWLMLHLEEIDYGVPSFYPNYYRSHIVSQQVAAGDILAQPSREKGEKNLESRIGMYMDGIQRALVRIRDRNLFSTDETRLIEDKRIMTILPKYLKDHAGTSMGEFMSKFTCIDP